MTNIESDFHNFENITYYVNVQNVTTIVSHACIEFNQFDVE